MHFRNNIKIIQFSKFQKPGTCRVFFGHIIFICEVTIFKCVTFSKITVFLMIFIVISQK